MAEVKNVISNDTLPIPIDERFGVYLMKKNGECASTSAWHVGLLIHK